MSRQFKRMVALAVALVISGSAVAITKAGGPGKRPPMDPRGEPEGLKKGITECYKVWHNDDGWHVHVVNGRGTKDHRYQGTITVENGVLEGIRSPLARKNGAEALWKSGPKKNELSWDFATPEKEDGINFKASKGAVVLRLTLLIDDKEVPNQIFIGKRGDHPETSTFEVAAHPSK